MLFNIIQAIIVIALFLIIKWLAWNVTERRWGFPAFLDYQPYNCYKCLSFWSLSASYTAVGLLFQAYIVLICGLLLTVLDTIAYIIYEKNNTLKLEDYELHNDK